MDLPSEDLTAVQHASTAASLISGSVGGMMQVLVGQPLVSKVAFLPAQGQIEIIIAKLIRSCLDYS
jgi:hypothetical protein